MQREEDEIAGSQRKKMRGDSEFTERKGEDEDEV